ncbi:MAG: hypothetical protein IPN71_17575 [Fibrobacteres bacterium]|nr:hypothetical protein [Fibrobacterota bacterium]
MAHLVVAESTSTVPCTLTLSSHLEQMERGGRKWLQCRRLLTLKYLQDLPLVASMDALVRGAGLPDAKPFVQGIH